MYKNWVLDITNEEFCWVPVDNDGNIVIGLAIFSEQCPGKPIGFFHQDGVDAVEEWLDTHGEELEFDAG